MKDLEILSIIDLINPIIIIKVYIIIYYCLIVLYITYIYYKKMKIFICNNHNKIYYITIKTKDGISTIDAFDIIHGNVWVALLHYNKHVFKTVWHTLP